MADESRRIQDYISGEMVPATPEEVDAVQILARRLVEDFGYAKDEIQTHPQFRVRKRPSDEERTYPVDIAVFSSQPKIEANLFLIAECKEKDKKAGIAQLQLYMDMSPAEVGIWFNGEDHAYFRKVVFKDGRRIYHPITSIPRRGQRIDDIGKFRRADLVPPSTLKSVFRDLRNHLAGNVTGITRDEALAQEVINLLFCKIHDEVDTGRDDVVSFRAGVGESPEDVRKRIVSLFGKVKRQYTDVFDESESIKIDADNLVYVVGELQNYCVTEADRDAVGEAFEVFIGPALRGSEGQFFTPRNVVRMIVEILDPEPEERILDPACGSGGFLIVALEHVWKKLERRAQAKGWDAVTLDRAKRDVATRYFRGIDKDSFLAKVTKAYMAIIGDGRGGVFCENSLLPTDRWRPDARAAVIPETFDVILTNPPFGTKIPVKGEDVLAHYELGFKWRKDKKLGHMTKTDELHKDQPPQILFLERCLQFLNNKGRMGIVLPEAVLGMPTYQYVVEYLRQHARIRGVVSMPEALFKTSGKGGTHAKTCVVFIQKDPPKAGEDYPIFMADVKWCGHDSRGNPTIRKLPSGEEVLLDEVPAIPAQFRELVGNAK